MTATATRRPANSPPVAAGNGGFPPRWRPSFLTRPATSPAATDAIATAALTVLTLAGVFSLSRLFIDHSFAGPVLLVTIGAHAVAWLCRRRGWPPAVATVLSLLALIFLISWAVLPGSTFYGLPVLGTLRAASHAIHQATVDFHQVTAPAPVTQGFVLVTASGAGILAVLADWAAFRMRATLEATVPSFALFIFCAAIGSRTGRTPAVIVEAAAVIAFVVIHQAAVDQETSAWFANRTRGALTSSLSAGAILGLAALIVALNLGFRLPGANKKGVIAWRGGDIGSGTRSTESPLVGLRGRLLHPDPTQVFTVTSNQPEYWRMTALDTFDGTDWNALSTYRSLGGQLSGGSTPTIGGQKVEQDFSITNLSLPWLPAAYRPVSVTGIKGVTYDPQSGSLISETNTLTGLTYHVTSIVSAGDSEKNRLESAPAVAKGVADHYLLLPPQHSKVTDLAHQIVAGQVTEYDKAIAIQNFLRDPTHFTYTLNYDYTGPDPLDHFLFTARQGYCQQFAGSFAVLARIVGLPTRLAAGWTWGTGTAPGVYRVTDENLHTWPEVYFNGVGWVAFEPTPGRGIPGAQNYTGVPAAEAGAQAPDSNPTATTVPATAGTGPGARPTTTSSIPASGSKSTGQHHGNPYVRLLLWLAAVLSGAALLLGLVIALRWLQNVATRDRLVNQAAELESETGPGPPGDRFARFRKDWDARDVSGLGVLGRRLKAIVLLGWLFPIFSGRSRPGALRPEVVTRAEVLLTWAELLDLLAWWGVRRHPSETHRELVHRAAIELRVPLSLEPASVGALLHLADAATKAEFGLGSIAPEEAEASAANLATVKRALVRSATNVQRLRLAVDPRLTVKVRH